MSALVPKWNRFAGLGGANGHLLKDRTHIRDLIGVGLVDRCRLVRLPAVLAERLERILDTPDA